MLQITIRTEGKAEVSLEGIDAQRKQTVFFRREKHVHKKAIILLNMPVSPEKLKLIVKSNLPTHVTVLRKALPARQTVEISEETADFIDHALEFSLHASYLPDSQIYTNEIGELPIEYVPRLYSLEGEELSGPAKVARGTGYVTVNAPLFRTFTVSMRMFVLLHEWFHYHANTGNETEVDIHALQVYLALGFPKLEVMTATAGLFEDRKGLINRVERILAYLKTYQDSPTCNLKQRCA